MSIQKKVPKVPAVVAYHGLEIIIIGTGGVAFTFFPAYKGFNKDDQYRGSKWKKTFTSDNGRTVVYVVSDDKRAFVDDAIIAMIGYWKQGLWETSHKFAKTDDPEVAK